MDNKVSIIIPAYNIESYLGGTLDSVLAQTYKNLEIIVVNDGSTDNTAQVIDTYASRDSRIIPIHKENGGVTSARLRGIEESTGEFIGFVDGDDIIEPQMYQVLLQNALTYNADISHCGYQLQFPGQPPRMFHGTGKLEVMDHLTGLRELIVGTHVEPGLCYKLYRRSVVTSALLNSPPPSSIRNNEDLLMNFSLFSHAEQTVFHDVCPYHYIVRSNSASRSKLNSHHIYDPLTVRQIIRDSVPESLSAAANRAYLCYCIGNYNYILYQTSPDYAADLKNIRNKLRLEKAHTHLLSTKERIMFFAICYFPRIYSSVFRILQRMGKRSPYL